MDSIWNSYSGNLPPIPQPIKRKIFISYHHQNDQTWYDNFSQTFSDQLELFFDNSLDRDIDSDNAEYVERTIKEDHIRGSSITVVLLGTETWKRRWVDWEIHATLDEEHALLGIVLPPPYHVVGSNGGIVVPDRFHENFQSGYAYFIHWPTDYQTLNVAINQAIQKSGNKNLIRNSAPKMQRSKT